MKRLLLAVILCLTAIESSPAKGFDYVEWTNREGKGFIGKLERVEVDKVILRKKKGGKRFPVKISTLSDESKARLSQYQQSIKNEIANAPIGAGGYKIVQPDVVHRAVAMGMGSSITSDRVVVPGVIRKIRVTDRLVATLEFEGNVFKKIQAKTGTEFFIKEKTLNVRSSRKRGWVPYYYYYRGINEGARLLLKEGETLQIYVTPQTSLDWGTVGVTDGAIFRGD